MMEEPNFGLVEELMRKHKARYRIQWDYEDYKGGKVVGFWVWTCNSEAVRLKTSYYVNLICGK